MTKMVRAKELMRGREVVVEGGESKREANGKRRRREEQGDVGQEREHDTKFSLSHTCIKG